MPDANPLLARDGLPRYDAVRPEHVEPAMRAILAELGDELTRLEASLGEAEPGALTWERVVEPLERLGDRLALPWGVVGHMLGVQNSDALRAAHEAVQPEVVVFSMRMGQSRPIFEAAKALRANDAGLDDTQRRILDSLIRDAEFAGVGLEGEARERFNAIQTELAELATRFMNHVIDATKAFSLVLCERDQVAGLPPSFLEGAAAAAREAGEAAATAADGPWRVGLDDASFMTLIEHAADRALREQLFRARATRASHGELDNNPLIRRMLKLRAEEATLLGYGSFAECSLKAKMAPDVAAVTHLIEELRSAAWEPAHREIEDLRAFAREQAAPEADDLRPWDLAYWFERLREARFDFSDEELRPYFPLPRVLDGLFALARDLFGVTITAADGEAPIWHPDVRFFRVADESGARVASFYLDPYARPAEKRGGAWMEDCVGRSRLLAAPGERVRLPVAHLICNQTPPVGGRPACMSFHEVETLFHEFGHGLQHMLTTVDYGLASGIRNIEWDAVELASQFMENWLYHEETLLGLTEHVETGERLPEAIFARIHAARTFRQATLMLRQLVFAATDMELHTTFDPDGEESPNDVMQRVAKRTNVIPPLPEDRMLCSFGHLFGGGYAAGYYSYKWAEVLSADAFAAFEEAGLDDAQARRKTGRHYRDTILALGGSRPPMEVFRAFRGREPSTRALLRHAGLLEG